MQLGFKQSVFDAKKGITLGDLVAFADPYLRDAPANLGRDNYFDNFNHAGSLDGFIASKRQGITGAQRQAEENRDN